MKYTAYLVICCSLVSIQCNAIYVKKAVIAAKTILSQQVRKNSKISFLKIKQLYCFSDGSLNENEVIRKNEMDQFDIIKQAIKVYEEIPAFQEKKNLLDLLYKHNHEKSHSDDCQFCLYACKKYSGEIHKILSNLYKIEEQKHIEAFYCSPEIRDMNVD